VRAGVALTALLVLPAVAEARPKPQRLHVDCSATRAGDGSRERPWNSLERVRTKRLRAGGRLLLRRGTVCEGTLEPRGSGSRRRPATIGAYGRGTRPRIDASGEDAVLLKDMSHVVLQSLELTNRGDRSSKRRGVHLVAERTVVRNVTVQRMYIHHVEGDMSKDGGGSGAIQVDVTGELRTPPQRYAGLRILNNRIEEVARSGIFLAATTDLSRPRATEPWPEASSGVVIRGNRLSGLDGDGIVPVGTEGALVERNVVSDGNRVNASPVSPERGPCSAGIWTFHANNTVIQHNEVFGMNFQEGNGCDGTGYDVDYDQDGTIVQFNYSHENEGGFILLCTDDSPRIAHVRYNLSVDDRYAIQGSPCPVRQSELNGIRFYNNTIVAPQIRFTAPLEIPIQGTVPLAGDFAFRNNILYAKEPQGEPFPCGDFCSHNLFFNLPPSGTDAVTGDPLFEDPAANGRGFGVPPAFRVQDGSPAIRAGTAIEGTAPRDFFGNPVPRSSPSIGFHERP
jgi:hypothetical protein